MEKGDLSGLFSYPLLVSLYFLYFLSQMHVVFDFVIFGFKRHLTERVSTYDDGLQDAVKLFKMSKTHVVFISLFGETLHKHRRDFVLLDAFEQCEWCL